MLLLALFATLPPAAQATTAWVATSTEKIRPTDPMGAGAAAQLSAARNEFEAFQVAIAGPASGVSVTVSPLAGPSQLPAPHLFREALIALANASGPDGAVGPFPDALVPDVDDVVGEKRNAFPFDVPAGENRVVFVEQFVPPNAPPGVYQGSVTVHASGQSDLVVPITLTVWNFALPSTSSLRSFFALYWGDLVTAHAGVSGDALSALRARYSQLGLDHRISLSGFDDGSSSLDHLASFYGSLFDGTAPTQLPGATLTTVRYTGNATSQSEHASWAAFFKGRGWFDRLFDYTCDEPPATCAWSDIPARAAIIKQADPAFRTLVTTNVSEAQANGVLSSIDILVPVVNQMYDKPGTDNAGPQRANYDAFLASGSKELWMYQSCMSHGCGGTSDYFSGWPSYAIDANGVRGRAMEWLSFLYRATGELYWDTGWAFENGDAWTNQWYFGGNGDGTLFYPGTTARIGGQTDIPVASLRLKLLREGMEDFEYLKALADAGDPTLAFQIASTLFPNPWTPPGVADLLAARDRIARRIVELGGGTADPTTRAAAATSVGAVASTGTPSLSYSGSGCSAGSSGEFAAALGVVIALLLRRRRRRGSAPCPQSCPPACHQDGYVALLADERPPPLP